MWEGQIIVPNFFSPNNCVYAVMLELQYSNKVKCTVSELHSILLFGGGFETTLHVR